MRPDAACQDWAVTILHLRANARPHPGPLPPGVGAWRTRSTSASHQPRSNVSARGRKYHHEIAMFALPLLGERAGVRVDQFPSAKRRMTGFAVAKVRAAE